MTEQQYHDWCFWEEIMRDDEWTERQLDRIWDEEVRDGFSG